MAKDATVRIAAVADTRQLARDMKRAEDVVGKFGKNIKRVGAEIGGALAIGAFIKGGLDELKEQERVAAQTASAIKATGGAAKVTASEVSALSEALQDKYGKDKELIQSGANLILTFRNIKNEVGEGNDIFDRATEAALDLSVSGFGDLTTTSKQLGKALQDPVKGVTALRRAGVTFSESQQATIRSLVETGDLLGAQKLILAEVEMQVGGAAEAYGNTLPGKLERAGNAFDDVKASVISGAVPALEALADVAVPVGEAFSALPGPIQTATLALAGLAITGNLGNAVVFFRELPKNFDKVAIKAYDAAGGVDTFAAKAKGLSSLVPAAAAVGVASFAIAELIKVVADNEFAEDADRIRLALDTLGKSGERIGAVDDQAIRDLGDAIKGANDAASNNSGSGLAGLGDLFEELLGKGEEAATDIDRYDQALASLAQVSAPQAKVAFDSISAALQAQGVPVEQINAAFSDYLAISGDVAAAAGVTGEATGELADETTELDSALQDANKALDTAAGSIKKYFDQITAGLETDIEFQAAIDDLTDAILENGATLDINTEAGRDNAKAALKARDAILAFGEEALRSTGSVDKAKEAVFLHTLALADQLRQAGLTEDQVAEYIATINLTPEAINTAFTADVAAAMTNIAALNFLIAESIRNGVLLASVLAPYEDDPNIAIIRRSGAVVATGPGRAVGGPVFGNNTYMVGENGPEMLTLGANSKGRVTPMGGGPMVLNDTIVIKIDDREIGRAQRRRELATR